MKTAVLTGGTGFLGFGLLKTLLNNGVFVYVLVRSNSKRRERLNHIDGIKIIEVDMEEEFDLSEYVNSADVFYHLAWEGTRNDLQGQMKNINIAVNAMKAAYQIGIKQFLVTGSQAEYGIVNHEINEDTLTAPNTAYGSCKLACYYILSSLASQLNIPFTWVRVFSVYGEGDNPNTLISYLFKSFKENKIPELTSGNQIWDYLYIDDAADALYLLGDKGKTGLFNLASGDSRPLKEYIVEARNLISPSSTLKFNVETDVNVVQLKVDVKKIQLELGWKPEINFLNGIWKMKR
ncbi:NAD-dependent epimerase/dehydratase family protein [Paenibacillus sp. TAB 01]|uniref:NAD-dependent epimerase/dehydratase family protein n=1 Tax=Paenibacillus sp. TAB 01 TaxID=3368988 RepID=UPI00374FEF1F